ncbi:S1 family serine peptidase [Vibrio alfacsensis]|uniref:S1 family serine peptidase n=1 Tax=Vibrio alfacsensis TaxID=1074311 RepID=UPI0040691F9E
MRLLSVLISGVCLLAPFVGMASNSSSNTNPNLSAFIVGGQQASANQLPFFARVILHRSGAKQFSNLCGGSIVNDRYIMTAAHCVAPDVFTDEWSINDLRVLVKNPTMDNVYLEEFKDVRTITIHPDYDGRNLWINDIAILELTHPITDNVKSISLPQDFGDYSDQSVYQIFGLGQTSTRDEIGPNYLRWAEVQPLTDTQCASLVSGYHAQESICANGFPDRDYTGVCGGDSGGPLTYQDNNEEYQQIGIVSYGSFDCESPSVPSVFTEILNYTSWIEAQTSSGAKTNYDASLAAREDYHSQGDSGFEPEETIRSDQSDSSGGSTGWFTLLLGTLLFFRRKTHKTQQHNYL